MSALTWTLFESELPLKRFKRLRFLRIASANFGLTRSAYVYIRQSTADQLQHNRESRRRQYGLADRARQLGWNDDGEPDC